MYISNMEKAFKIGKMELNMKEIGEKEWLKAKVCFIMLMEMYIVESFIRTELMDLENMCIRMARSIKDSGRVTCKMDQERKN